MRALAFGEPREQVGVPGRVEQGRLVGQTGVAGGELNVCTQDAQGTAKRLRAISGELSDRFYERADVVRTLVVTLLAGQHSLVLLSKFT